MTGLDLTFGRFALVGAIGFVVDVCAFTLLAHGAGLPALAARSGAFLCAASATWLGNRRLTFAGRKQQAKRRQWTKAIMAALCSAVPNLLTFQGMVLVLGEQGIAPYLALAGGVLAGMISNFQLSRRWVFAGGPTEVPVS